MYRGDEDGVSTDSHTDAASVEDRYLVARLGAMLKERRSGRFTIEALAARAGISAGLISQIERGIGNPSFATLVRLSYALDLPLSAMFEGPNFDEQQMVVRRADRQRLDVPGDGTVHEMLVVPNANHKLGVISTVFPPGFASMEPANSHPGEEVVLVVKGKLNATIGGQAFQLDEGDSIIFDSSLPHVWENPTDQPTETLFISTPPASGVAH